MANLAELTPFLGRAVQLREARVRDVTEGGEVKVEVTEDARLLECQVLHTGTSALTLSVGDVVLVWVRDDDAGVGVVLGRLGLYTEAAQAVVSPDEFATRPESLVLETQGDLVLRNGQSKITLGAKGDVEIVCKSFTTRSHRLLRLLAPLIKLN